MRELSAAVLCILSALLLGSNCEDTEILGPANLAVESNDTESTIVIALPYVGRTSLDWAITNTGPTASEFSILALAEQDENPNDERCERLSENTDISYDLNEFASEPPVSGSMLAGIDSNGTLYDIGLEKVPEGFEGWARLAGLTGRAEFVVAPPTVQLRVVDANGNVLPPLSSQEAECSEDIDALGVRTYRLEDEIYRLRLFAPKQSILLSVAETCISRETVDRTCAGTQGDLAERRVTVAPSGQQTGRFHTLDLGVGNAITVTASCESTSTCQGSVDLAPYIEPLECRTDDDCSARRSCSSDGYCLREPSGCQSGSTGVTWSTALLALGLFGAALRWRRRFGWVSRLLQVVCCVSVPLLVLVPATSGRAQSSEASWSSFTELSAGVSVVSTNAITNGDAGFTFGIAQGIRYNRFIFSLGLDGSYYIIEPDGLPVSRGLRIFDVKSTVGYLAPAGPLSVSAEGFYELRQFRSNALVAQTGDDPIHHGIGLASTIRYPATRTLFLALRPYYGVTVSTDSPMHEAGALLVVGFSATID